MVSFEEWLAKPIKFKKKRTKNYEPRSNQTHGEGRNVDQQRQTARGNSKITQQTIHLFPMPKL